MFVIRRNDGLYVSPSGSRCSYTRYLEQARKFNTQESAERERCPGNERVISVWDVLR